MAIILATETSKNKKAFAYGKRLLSSIKKQANLKRPSVHIRSSIFDKKLFTFKVNIGSDSSLDKVLIIQQENKEDFVVTPQYEPSYFDMQYPQSGVYQIGTMGEKVVVQKDTNRQQFGNIIWIGDKTIFGRNSVLSYHGPTNMYVGFDTSSSQNGFQTEALPLLYTPYTETVYAKGKQLVQGLPTTGTSLIVGAAYIYDISTPTPIRYLELAVITIEKATLPDSTISEAPIDRGFNNNTYKLQFFFTKDKPQNITTLQDGFAASSNPIWNIATYSTVLNNLPLEVGCFSSDGKSFYINNQKFDISALEASFTCSEDTTHARIETTGSQVIISDTYTTTTYGVSEVWLDGSNNITSISNIKNNYITSDNTTPASFGIGSGSFSSTTNTTRFVATPISPDGTPNPSDSTSIQGAFIASGKAVVFKELARFCPILYGGHSVISITRPSNGMIPFTSRSNTKAVDGNGNGSIVGGNGSSSEVDSVGRFKSTSGTEILKSFAKLGKFLLEGESTTDWHVTQTLTASISPSLKVDHPSTLNINTTHPLGYPRVITDYDPHSSITRSGVSLIANHATGVGSKYPLDTEPYYTITQQASDDGIYLEATPYVVNAHVNKGDLTIFINAPNKITYGTKLKPLLSTTLGRFSGTPKTPVSTVYKIDGMVLDDSNDPIGVLDSPVSVQAIPTLTTDDTYDYNAPTATLGSDTATVIIEKADLTLKFNDYSELYSPIGITYSDVEAIGYTFTGFVNGETEITSDISGAPIYDVTMPNDIGTSVTYPIVNPGKYGVFISGFTSDNYDILNPTGYLTINKLPITITWGGEVSGNQTFKAFNGSAQKPEYTTTPLLNTLSPAPTITWEFIDYLGNMLLETPFEVGVYSAKLKIESPHYYGEATTEFTIYPPQTVFLVSETYDGTPKYGLISLPGYKYKTNHSDLTYYLDGNQIPPPIQPASAFGSFGNYLVSLSVNQNGLIRTYTWSLVIDKAFEFIPVINISGAITTPGGGVGAISPQIMPRSKRAITYSCLNSNVSIAGYLISCFTAGTYTINAHCAGNDNYRTSDATYTLIVLASNTNPPVSVSFENYSTVKNGLMRFKGGSGSYTWSQTGLIQKGAAQSNAGLNNSTFIYITVMPECYNEGGSWTITDNAAPYSSVTVTQQEWFGTQMGLNLCSFAGYAGWWQNNTLTYDSVSFYTMLYFPSNALSGTTGAIAYHWVDNASRSYQASWTYNTNTRTGTITSSSAALSLTFSINTANTIITVSSGNNSDFFGTYYRWT